MRSISRSWCAARATWRCRLSATRRQPGGSVSSATAPCSGAIKRSWNGHPPCFWRDRQRAALCQAALQDRARGAVRSMPARWNSCRTPTGDEFYFIEVDPRIQVEHTVTECATGIDLVKAQIRIADGARIGDPASGVPAQPDIHLIAHALQCRVTTEDPFNNFVPDYGRMDRLSQSRRLWRAARRRHRLRRCADHALL